MLDKIFPFKTHLHIFQLEGYKPSRFIMWLSRNFFIRDLENKIPLKWTQKAKTILSLSLLIYLVVLCSLTKVLSYLGLFIGILLFTQPYIFILSGYLLLRPYEILNKYRVKKQIKGKILSLKKKGLKVIGITGSFGKTSTKEFLYQLLRKKYLVLKTPESYNTLFGIAKVIDLELEDTYDFFICELGAYKKGEVKELCEMVLPDYGILTGINEQHLERFGSLENTVEAKFELVTFIKNPNNVFLNIDNSNVKSNYAEYISEPNFYGISTIKDIKRTGDNTSFLFKKEFPLMIPLVGKNNLSNVLAAISLSLNLGLTKEEIQKGVKHLKPMKHRLEIKKLENGNILLDDAYSSNIDGFNNALELLNSYNDRKKIIVTPGIIELGSETTKIHKALGVRIDTICDYVFLVGENDRTKSIESSFVGKKKITYLKSIRDLWSAIEEKKVRNYVLLIENDLPDNY